MRFNDRRRPDLSRSAFRVAKDLGLFDLDFDAFLYLVQTTGASPVAIRTEVRQRITCVKDDDSHRVLRLCQLSGVICPIRQS